MEVIKQGPLLTMEQQTSLCVPFSDHVIKEALFSIPNTTSPGPNGYNSGFYKVSWHKIGPLVCEAMRDFFSTGRMPT